MRIVSGIRPTDKIHIGNYLGVLRNWVKLQYKHECFFFVADLHALTTKKYPKEHTFELAKAYLAAGLNPQKCTIFLQSSVPQCIQLSWIFSCLMPIGELERMTQYKDKGSGKKSIGAGLLFYPCLMAADILLYKGEGVPVGKDQAQHVELTRKFARKFNRAYSSKNQYKFFPEPKPILTQFACLMSLQDPRKKMSKSKPKGCLFLNDTPNKIKKKIKKAVTTPQGVANLHDLLKAFDGPDKEFAQYAKLKNVLSEQIINELEPIQKRMKQISNDQVKQVLKAGNKKASAIAQKTMKQIRAMMLETL